MKISKTLSFSLLLAIFGSVEANIGIMSQYMSKELFGGFSIAVAAIVAVLRVLTVGPVGK